MKRKSNEMNVFSMSALDLFASALGAFILITLALFPFFPNTGDSPERIADVRAELQDQMEELQRREAAAAAAAEEARRAAAAAAEREARLRGELEDAERAAEEAAAAASSVDLPPLDLVIALDTTASMERQVDGLRDEITELAAVLEALSDDVGIGLIDFKDRCDPPSAVRAQDLLKVDRASLAQLRRFAASMRAISPNCNQDPPEAIAAALETAMRMTWRPSSDKRTIVLITDNPAYADQTQRTIDLARQFASATESKNAVSTMMVRTDNQLPATQSFLQQVATAGKGNFIQEDTSASFSVMILRALADK